MIILVRRRSRHAESFREVVSHSSIVQAGPVYDLVRRVASRLVRVVDTGSDRYQWQVAVVQNPAQNAFCLPGGKIVVSNESESIRQLC